MGMQALIASVGRGLRTRLSGISRMIALIAVANGTFVLLAFAQYVVCVCVPIGLVQLSRWRGWRAGASLLARVSVSGAMAALEVRQVVQASTALTLGR